MRKLLDPATFRWVVLAPAGVYGAALTVGAFWFPQLPNPIASQWTGGGDVTSTQSLAAFYATIAGLMLGTIALLFLTAVKGKNPRDVRLTVAGGVGMAPFAGGAMLLLASGQRGIPDAYSAPSPSWVGMALLAVLGVVVGAIVWRLYTPAAKPAISASE